MKKLADKRVLLAGGIIIAVALLIILFVLIGRKNDTNVIATEGAQEGASSYITDAEEIIETTTETEEITELETEYETETEPEENSEIEDAPPVVEQTYYLPVISIVTENHQPIVEKDEKIAGQFSLNYKGVNGYANVESAAMTIKGRGHSTWKLDKKPYKIKFDEKTSLFGLTAAKEWVLLANHADKSLIRNKLAFDVGNVLDNVLFTPHAYNVDVYVNGDYMGVYTLVEQVEVKDGRIEGEVDGAEVDTDYLLELGGEKEETSFGSNVFHSLLYVYIEVKNPDTDVLTKEQYDYVKSYVKEADRAVINLDGYEEYIDIPSLIDWFILNELSYNIDGTFRRSDYLLKQKGGKLYMATYWDYDYAFGNFWRDSQAFDEWICLGNENTVKDEYIKANWITYLLEDPNFTTQLKSRWEGVKDRVYQAAMGAIDDAEKYVAPSAEKNFERWEGILGKKIQYENSNCAVIGTYEGQLDYLRDFVEKRYQWMDMTIKAM